MTDFELALKTSMEQCIIKAVQGGNILNIPLGERIEIPESYIREVWNMVDHKKIKQHMADNIEKTLADKICNHLAAEISTDIKQVLSVKERRESLRALARDNIDKICSPKN